MESQVCSVQLMAYRAMSHDCVVGGLQHDRLLRGERTHTRAYLSLETK